MTDKAPERIWVCPQYEEKAFHDFEFGGWPEYVRADILEAAQARIAELEAEAERRDEQIQTMIEASGQTCACGYDRASDVCLGHYSHFKKSLASARAEALEEAAKEMEENTNLGTPLCCNGHECGCHGASVGEYAAFMIRALKGCSNG